MKQILRLAAVLSVAAMSQAGAQQTVYSNIPTDLAPNYPSLGYEATSTSQFGNLLHLAPGDRYLSTVSVVLSNWAYQSMWADNYTDPNGYNHPLTLNVYSVGASNSVGSLLGSLTESKLIAWRPEPGTNQCRYPGYIGTDLNCYNGLAQKVTFDFTGQSLVVPDNVIISLAFNTADYGANPLHADGPYNSLNFALGGYATVGSEDFDTAYIQSTYPGYDGTFVRDGGWDEYTPMIEVETTTPEPASLVLLGTGIAAIVVARRRRRSA